MQTSFYAAFLTLFYIILSVNVIRGRRQHLVAKGDGDIDDMKARIRAHGNCAEYAPLFIVLLAMVEYQGLAQYAVHGFGALFILGRLSHAYGLLAAEPRRRSFKPRVTGMALTFTCLGGLAIILLYQRIFL